MSGGVIVVAGSVVIAVALFETAFPRVRAAFVRRRIRRAEDALDAPCGKGDSSVLCPPSADQKEDFGQWTADSGRRQGEKPLARGVDCAGNGRSATNEAQGRDGTDLAQRLWDEAREMTHCFKPNWGKDSDYLAKVYAAAKLGHPEAMAKLGEYAARREAVVEAFYWTLLAELKGAKGLKTPLRELRSRWLALGCPLQYRNTYGEFSAAQATFARAVLRLQCGIDPQYARTRLKELAESGLDEARLYLKR